MPYLLIPINWVNLFKTTFVDSRVLGGLISAYDLSGDEVFLEKARDIADRLLPAWNTPTGIPYNLINLAYGNAHNPRWTGVSSPAHKAVALHGHLVKVTFANGFINLTSLIIWYYLFCSFIRSCWVLFPNF